MRQLIGIGCNPVPARNQPDAGQSGVDTGRRRCRGWCRRCCCCCCWRLMSGARCERCRFLPGPVVAGYCCHQTLLCGSIRKPPSPGQARPRPSQAQTKPGQARPGQDQARCPGGLGEKDARDAAPGWGGKGAYTQLAAIPGCSAAWYSGKSVVWPIGGGANAAMADTSASNWLFSSALPAEVLNRSTRFALPAYQLLMVHLSAVPMM